MQNFLRFSGAVGAVFLAFALSAPSAVAQEKTAVWGCQVSAASSPEPLGDREGHSILGWATSSCRAESGLVGRQRRDRCGHVGVGRPESHADL